jgi:hypothetical protein
MPYNNVIARGDVNEVPDDLSTEIVQNATDQSAVMSLFRRANVSKRQSRFPVLAALPTAYWVNGDTGLKQTTQMAWANKMLNVEELAAIVPVPENVIDDADFDVWGEVRPRLEEAIGRALDEAVIAGINAPAAFPTNIVAAATAAGNAVEAGATAAEGGAFGDMDDLIGVLEDDGYDPTGYASRTTQGERNDRDRVDAKFTEFDGDPVTYVGAGIFPEQDLGVKGLLAVAAQWDKFVLGVRKDITMKVLDQAVIQDNTGAIIYNLPQQDMVALRVTFRAGWEFANPISAGNDGADRYPAAVLQTPAGV